jgi:hypothetical protein
MISKKKWIKITIFKPGSDLFCDFLKLLEFPAAAGLGSWVCAVEGAHRHARLYSTLAVTFLQLMTMSRVGRLLPRSSESLWAAALRILLWTVVVRHHPYLPAIMLYIYDTVLCWRQQIHKTLVKLGKLGWPALKSISDTSFKPLFLFERHTLVVNDSEWLFDRRAVVCHKFS